MIRCSVQWLNGWTPVMPIAMPRRSARAAVARRPSAISRAAEAKLSCLTVRNSSSLAMSSPEKRSRSRSSAPSIMSSKRLTRASVSGSSSWNSSSTPIVKSVDDSNRSRTPARMLDPGWSISSGTGANSRARSWPRPLRQIEVERVEELDGRARGVDRHVGRDGQERVRVVEDDLHAGGDQVVRDHLGRVRRHGEHADHDPVVADHLRQLGVVADQEVADARAHLVRVGVEDRGDPEPVVGEDPGAGDRLAEVARAEQGDVVLPRGAQDLPDLADQQVDVVADAALAELAESGQVPADLSRVDVRVLGDRLRGDGGLPHLLRLRQHLQVSGQPRGDPKREPILSHGPLVPPAAGSAGRRACDTPLQKLVREITERKRLPARERLRCGYPSWKSALSRAAGEPSAPNAITRSR